MNILNRDGVHAALAALALFAVYAATAPRSVMMEDDGSFILASYFLGVAHPPGYPLFTLLGKVFTFLPFGSVAYRVHLLSATFGALGVAMVWLCARTLTASRLYAYAAALALGLSPAFWSQAIIAEVYTLNVFFLFTLLYFALRRGSLAAMALVFGLSLSNHWPLMLLVSPAFAVLLWPRRREVAQRLPVLLALLLAGLLPYAWMVALSNTPLAVSFAGPIGSLQEFWFFVSRAGYTEVDVSRSATWLDRLGFFGFFGSQLLLQFAVVGTMLAALGFWAQWREWGRGVAAALSIAFFMPSAALIMLLGFDYDSFHKHIFHVYPLPAYGVAALWLALGIARLVRHLEWRLRTAIAACFLVLAAIGSVGLYANQLSGYSWVERYGRALLTAMPQEGVVLLKGVDIGPLGYLHMVEGLRPDLTLYHPEGLVLGNRLFHPYRTDQEGRQSRLRELLASGSGPVATTDLPLAGYTWHDHWLFATLDRAGGGPAVDIPVALRRFFEDHVLDAQEKNAFIAFYQGELRRRYAALLAAHGDPGGLESVARDFWGSIGAVEGLLARPDGYSIAQAASLLERAAQRMPADAGKSQQARFLELRAYVRLHAGDRRGAVDDLKASITTWPTSANGANLALKRMQAP